MHPIPSHPIPSRPGPDRITPRHTTVFAPAPAHGCIVIFHASAIVIPGTPFASWRRRHRQMRQFRVSHAKRGAFTLSGTARRSPVAIRLRIIMASRHVSPIPTYRSLGVSSQPCPHPDNRSRVPIGVGWCLARETAHPTEEHRSYTVPVTRANRHIDSDTLGVSQSVPDTFRHSATPPLRHSATPPLRHSATRHPATPPFHRSTIPPFRPVAIPGMLGIVSAYDPWQTRLAQSNAPWKDDRGVANSARRSCHCRNDSDRLGQT
ncbi:hypothetical protein PMIN01_09000 [Paraphaeosphaeria minitans]|uniref:Uncharacterized protein n=1 Tax=Paraphaeosphaeria minitans TaxID=565426 RepID=A0A9P6GD03_9PLEO|nr:hypothetical protein PMIN01_09000 [Paraphaeosphaeria minitans]